MNYVAAMKAKFKHTFSLSTLSRPALKQYSIKTFFLKKESKVALTTSLNQKIIF